MNYDSNVITRIIFMIMMISITMEPIMITK